MATKLKSRKRRSTKPKLYKPPAPELGKVVSVEVRKASEDWCSYELKDGTVLHLRPVITSVVRSLEQYNQTGDPVYQLQAALVIRTEVPRKLKKRIK